MHCCIAELRSKDVINKKTGARLGCVVDAQIDTCTGCVVALVTMGRSKSAGFFARGEECLVRWEDVEVIGDDIILVNCAQMRAPEPHRRKGGMEGLFR